MARGLFVTGTDTGVGKTLVTAALLRGLAARGIRACGMKPVAAGSTFIDGAWRNDDVDALRAAGSITVPPGLDCPYLLREPASPHIAARLEGVTIDLEHIRRCHDALTARADAVIVEGAGGWFVPLNEQSTLADLCVLMDLPVLLVVGLRLGCLNHALLSTAAIRAAGLTLAGWVANGITPDMPHAGDNIETLRARIDAPLWDYIPFRLDPPASPLLLEWPESF